MTLMRIRTFQYFEFGRRRYRNLSALPLHGGDRVGVKGRVALDWPLLLTRAFGATSPHRGEVEQAAMPHFFPSLAAGPLRLALVDEGAHAEAKIVAAVAGPHQ